MTQLLLSSLGLLAVIIGTITNFIKFSETLNYTVNVAECNDEYRKFYENKKSLCSWHRQNVSMDIIKITCKNKLIIQSAASDFSIAYENNPTVFAREFNDFVVKSLQKLSTENEFPFELLLHLYAVNSIEEFIERTRTTRNMELHLDDKTFYYKLTEYGRFPELIEDRSRMTLRTELQMNLTEDFLARMGYLYRLEISGIDLKNLSTDLLKPVSNLTFLDVKCKSNTQKTFRGGILKHTPRLDTLKIRYCGIDEFPDDMLSNLTKISLLDFSHNNIKYIPDDFFKKQLDLRELYLNGNELEVFPVPFFEHLPNLNTLDCSDNRLKIFPSDPLKPHTQLTILILENNSLTGDITTNLWSYYPSLKRVNLSKNKIQNLNLHFLNEPSPYPQQLDLSQNPLRCYCNPYMTEFAESMNIIKTQPKLPTVNISCRLWEGYTREINLSYKFNEDCEEPQNIEKIHGCPVGCLCYPLPRKIIYSIDCAYRIKSKAPNFSAPINRSFLRVAMDLSGNELNELPVVLPKSSYAAVTELIAFNNNLQHLNASNIPPNLSYLDLRGNRLQHLDEDVIKLLNTTTVSKRFRLSNNPWKCDCDLVPLLTFIKSYETAFQDIEYINCQNGTKSVRLSELNKAALCPITVKYVPILVASLIVLSILLAVILAIIVYFYKNEHAIKVWLYAHNMCLWCVTEAELDKNKKYDAFISYSQKDEHFVHTILIPQLECGPIPFKLCVHNRDWLVGAEISQQILESVEASRRTIVVISKNFIASNWGRFEFYVAYQNSLEEKRLRVIVVLYEIEIDEITNIDETLKAYLKTSTCLKWNDPLFWRNLRYAMPHSSQYTRKQTFTTTDLLAKTFIDEA